MVWKRWTAKMEGDETRAGRLLPRISLCACGIRMPRMEEIYDARGPPAVYVLCRVLPPERGILSLCPARVFSRLRMIYDTRSARVQAARVEYVHTERGRGRDDRAREPIGRRSRKLRFSIATNGNACERSFVESSRRYRPVTAKQINFPFLRSRHRSPAWNPTGRLDARGMRVIFFKWKANAFCFLPTY